MFLAWKQITKILKLCSAILKSHLSQHFEKTDTVLQYIYLKNDTKLKNTSNSSFLNYILYIQLLIHYIAIILYYQYIPDSQQSQNQVQDLVQNIGVYYLAQNRLV